MTIKVFSTFCTLSFIAYVTDWEPLYFQGLCTGLESYCGYFWQTWCKKREKQGSEDLETEGGRGQKVRIL